MMMRTSVAVDKPVDSVDAPTPAVNTHIKQHSSASHSKHYFFKYYTMSQINLFYVQHEKNPY